MVLIQSLSCICTQILARLGSSQKPLHLYDLVSELSYSNNWGSSHVVLGVSSTVASCMWPLQLSSTMASEQPYFSHGGSGHEKCTFLRGIQTEALLFLVTQTWKSHITFTTFYLLEVSH